MVKGLVVTKLHIFLSANVLVLLVPLYLLYRYYDDDVDPSAFRAVVVDVHTRDSSPSLLP